MNKDTIRHYDNGGKTTDRYTVVFVNKDAEKAFQGCKVVYDAICMNANPLDATGVFYQTWRQAGRSNGKRINFHDMPTQCQKAITEYLKEGTE